MNYKVLYLRVLEKGKDYINNLKGLRFKMQMISDQTNLLRYQHAESDDDLVKSIKKYKFTKFGGAKLSLLMS